MGRPRFEVQIETDPEYIEVGLVARVWDYQRRKAYGWYTSAADAQSACGWLNATNGEVG